MTDEIDISRADLSREEQIDLLLSNVGAWNAWRIAHPNIIPDLNKMHTLLAGHNLRYADLSFANLNEADLREADLRWANFNGAHLDEAELDEADLRRAYLDNADLRSAVLMDANLSFANLNEADLRWAILSGADLTETNLSNADLQGANLIGAHLDGTYFEHATLDDCDIYGISAWNVHVDGAVQTNLRITPSSEPDIRVDNLEVAQFLYMLLQNQKLRAVLDTIASKVVLILGRFSEERKPALDALREALRDHPNGYIPVLFDFDPQTQKPVLDTVKTLANLSRFVIADLTDPNMVRSELTYITANVPTVPIRSLIEGNAELPTEYTTWERYQTFLPVYRYANLQQLLASLDKTIIVPVEQLVHPHRLDEPIP